MRPMTNTALILVNGFAAVGLLTALALVMLTGHRSAGSESAGAGHWSQPLEPKFVSTERDETEFVRAA